MAPTLSVSVGRSSMAVATPTLMRLVLLACHIASVRAVQSVVCSEVLAHLHGCDAACGATWDGSACKMPDVAGGAEPAYCTHVSTHHAGCSHMCGLTWSSNKGMCVPEQGSTQSFHSGKEHAENHLNKMREEGGELAVKLSTYCLQLVEENNACEAACGYKWTNLHAKRANQKYETDEHGNTLQKIEHEHGEEPVCMPPAQPIQTPYCQLVGERMHLGCSVACGKTWSASQGNCITSQVLPKKPGDENAWDEYRANAKQEL